ncbi:MAG: protein arginine kinase [Oscillospiraceae bacterium]|jgi:protein arginine kinase|nr:protein arginine kinase [Oscillospiraceae bacterium]
MLDDSLLQKASESVMDNDVAISSRMRLARNFADLPFPGFMDMEQAQESVRRCVSALSDTLTPYALDKLPPLKRMILVEKHLISRDLLKTPERSAAMISSDEKLSVMINEEDHLRIQSFAPAFELDLAFAKAFEADTRLQEKMNFAYDTDLGFLTACPTNTGTGMRASVMLHLPALTWSGEISKVTQAVSKLGLTIRGLYGEGTEAQGDLYQLSNQVTLGRTEEEILSDVKTAASQMVEWERRIRAALHAGDKINLEDRMLRALGVLERARKITSKEFMQKWSAVRFASCMRVIPHNISVIDDLLVSAQPASLQSQASETLSDEQRDIRRAELVQSRLKV